MVVPGAAGGGVSWAAPGRIVIRSAPCDCVVLTREAEGPSRPFFRRKAPEPLSTITSVRERLVDPQGNVP